MSSDLSDWPVWESPLHRELADTEKLIEQSRNLRALTRKILAEEPRWDFGGASDGGGRQER